MRAEAARVVLRGEVAHDRVRFPQAECAVLQQRDAAIGVQLEIPRLFVLAVLQSCVDPLVGHCELGQAPEHLCTLTELVRPQIVSMSPPRQSFLSFEQGTLGQSRNDVAHGSSETLARHVNVRSMRARCLERCRLRFAARRCPSVSRRRLSRR